MGLGLGFGGIFEVVDDGCQVWGVFDEGGNRRGEGGWFEEGGPVVVKERKAAWASLVSVMWVTRSAGVLGMGGGRLGCCHSVGGRRCWHGRRPGGTAGSGGRCWS